MPKKTNNMIKTKFYKSHRLECLLLLFFMCVSFSISYAQDAKVITGKVLESPANTPLAGVTVLNKSTNKTTVSDFAGQFKIQAKSTDLLVISNIGFESQQITVGTAKSLNIAMVASTAVLNDVVVIGYGSVRKKDLTGSVSQVNMKELSKAPVGDFAQALSGRLAGVRVNSSDGQPGVTPNIVIRGTGSLTKSTSPLFVVDGFPLEDFNPNSLNAEDIESISVLKDASSTAVYGSRASNGVIVIQTKRGKAGNPVISFSNTFGYQGNLKQKEMMSPYEFLKYQLELDPAPYAYTMAYFPNLTSSAPLDSFKLGLNSYKDVAGVNMQDNIIQNGLYRTHGLSIRGGNDQTKYSLSGSLYDQTGVVVNTGFKRATGRFTLDHTISNKLKLGFASDYTNTQRFGEVVNSDVLSTSTPTSFIFARSWMYRPILPPSNTGNLLTDLLDADAIKAGGTGDPRLNPLTELQHTYSWDIYNIFNANAFLSYEPIKGLVFKSSAGIRNSQLRQERFYDTLTAQGANVPTNTNGVNGYIRNVQTVYWYNTNTINYNKDFKGGHHLGVLGLFELNQTRSFTNGYGGRNLPDPGLGINGLFETTSPTNLSSTPSKNEMVSYAGRLDYNFRSLYLLTATFRGDGSSKFPQNPWGYFPSAAFAWNLGNEQFFKDKIRAISTAKIRASYGTTGNNRVADYATYDQISLNTNYYGYSWGNQTPVVGLTNLIGNKTLEWEKTTTTNIGLELGFAHDRILLEADWYKRNTSNLLLDASIPASTGYSTITENVGSLSNNGVEFTLNTANIVTKNFSWKSTFNISFNANMITSLSLGATSLNSTVSYVSQFKDPLYMARIGQSTGLMVGQIWDGNYQLSDFNNPAPGVYILKPEIPTNGNARSTIQPGDIKYRDLNGDGVVNSSDLAVIGRGLPIHVGGFNNNFTYKRFSLNVFFQWSYGNDIYNANRLLLEGNSNTYHLINQYASYSNRWSFDNQTNENYRTRGQGPIGYWSSRVVEDGSYLRLKTLALNYNAPNSVAKMLYAKSLNLSVSGQNLITWTKYSGLDPEVSTRNNTLTPGYDYSSYPQSRTIVFSIIADF